jgi:hypothetical protein
LSVKWTLKKVMTLITAKLRQNSEGKLPSGPVNSQIRVQLEEHDYSHLKFNCTCPSLQSRNNQLVKKEIDKTCRETRKFLLKESTTKTQTLREPVSKEEIPYVD